LIVDIIYINDKWSRKYQI